MDEEEYRLMDEAENGMWWYRALHARLAHELRGQTHVLDAGCGTGGLLAALRNNPTRTGLEHNPSAACRAHQKSAAPIACGSVNALPFQPHSFDAVVSADVLCHAAVDPAAALSEFRRVLRPQGLLVLNMPAYAWLASAHDRRVHNARRVTPATLRTWLEAAGFTTIRTRFWNALLLPMMIAQRKLLARGDHPSDVARFPPWLDAILHAATHLERRLPIAWPAGGSLIATARSPETPA